MKKDIHPVSYVGSKVTCNSCGADFSVLSTNEAFTVEVCSNCHPFYTGDQRIMDSAGRADRFLTRMAKAEQIKAQTPKKAPVEKNEPDNDTKNNKTNESDESSEDIKQTQDQGSLEIRDN